MSSRARGRKHGPVAKAVRLEGPFEVWTDQGPTRCDDGWLAVDAAGNPFPVDAAVFEATHHPAGEVWP